MATVYILYSTNLNKFYIGSCLDIDERLIQHNSGEFSNSFTSKANDWSIYFSIEKLDFEQARKIEKHIKKMKSRKFIENLTIFPEISKKLITKYSAGSSR